MGKLINPMPLGLRVGAHELLVCSYDQMMLTVTTNYFGEMIRSFRLP